MRRRRCLIAAVLGAVLLVLLSRAHAGADVFGNVGPGFSGGGLSERYPLSHYGLDMHFTGFSASLTGGVHVSGIPALIAYFLANVLWHITAFSSEHPYFTLYVRVLPRPD